MCKCSMCENDVFSAPDGQLNGEQGKRGQQADEGRGQVGRQGKRTGTGRHMGEEDRWADGRRCRSVLGLRDIVGWLMGGNG